MEDTLGTREPRARPRERDPERRPRPDRDRHQDRPRDRPPDRPRDRPGDRRRERDGGRRGDRDRERGRDARQDRRRDAGQRAGEQRVSEKPPPSRTHGAARAPTWDTARAPAWDAARAPAWDTARAPAWDTARAPAWDAARAPTWDAARAPAWDTARAPAWDAARAPAWDTARAPAWDAARAPAWDAARAPAWDAARAPTWDTARAPAWDAARAPAWDAARAPAWDAAPPPWPAPWETPEPPSSEGPGRRAQAREPTLERYVPSYPRPGQEEEVEYYQSEAQGLLECHKCRYLCTGRGVVQIVEVILNGMVLMCIVASYFVLAGFSASFASGGGFGNNYYSPFEGTELEQVRQLDQQYTVLRSPLIYGGLAVSLGLGVLTMGVLVQGAKSLATQTGKWLLTEAAFSLLAALGYCASIGVYLHAALQINSTDTCKTRERLYARKGLTWMNCQLAGTDGAAATFACLLVIMYGASVVLALRSYREQKLYKDNQEWHQNMCGLGRSKETF